MHSKKSMRGSYPEDEQKYDWLPMLLDAYGILDRAVSLGLNNERRIRNQEVACRKGCSDCCMKPSIPITKVEMAGISWYTSEKLTGEIREQVKNQLLNHLETTKCPFLINTVCSIYPLRPIACRQFHVFGNPCEKGKDPSLTRPKDVWTPGRETAKKVALKILPFWGITSEKQKMMAYLSGFIHKESIEMHKLDWTLVYETMVRFDSKRF